MKTFNPTGKRFGRLVIESHDKKSQRVICICDCGNRTNKAWASVRDWRTRSCGCLEIESRKKHGMSGTLTYNSWENMWNRCTPGTRQNRNTPQYSKLSIDPKWKSFEIFFAEMGERPPGTSLDRIDNEKGYCAENCRWATRKVQQANMSSNRWITINGVTRIMSEWSRITGVGITTIYDRLSKGWPTELAITKPASPHGSRHKSNKRPKVCSP